MTITALPENIPVPANDRELAEMFNDGRYKTVLAAGNSDVFHSWVDAYGKKVAGEGTDVWRQVAEDSQRQLAAYLREKGVEGDRAEEIKGRLDLRTQSGRPAAGGSMLASYGHGAAHNPSAPGAPLDKTFASAIDYLKTIWHLNASADAGHLGKLAEIRNAASSVSAPDGGFLVPESLRSQLLQVAIEMSVVRPRATVIPMDSARVPFPTLDVTSNVSSLFGGMITYWRDESAALTDSSPKFGKVVLDANKLTGLSLVPNELLMDSIISFSALIETLWPRALAFEEDYKFMAGNGVGEPLGFLGAGNAASIAVPAEAGQGADTVDYGNIVEMYARMLPSSLMNAVWIVSPQVVPQLFKMTLAVGTGGTAMYVVNAAGPGPSTLFGRPVIVSEKAGALGNRGDIAFVDLSYYLIGDRQMVTASSSTDYRFGNDQTAYRIIQRVDGRPWIQSPITPRNGGDSLSPFVELAAR